MSECQHQWVRMHQPSIGSFIFPLPGDNDYKCLNCGAVRSGG